MSLQGNMSIQTEMNVNCNNKWLFGSVFLNELKSTIKMSTIFNLSLITLKKNGFEKIGWWSSTERSLNLYSNIGFNTFKFKSCTNSLSLNEGVTDSNRTLIVTTLLVYFIKNIFN